VRGGRLALVAGRRDWISERWGDQRLGWRWRQLKGNGTAAARARSIGNPRSMTLAQLMLATSKGREGYHHSELIAFVCLDGAAGMRAELAHRRGVQVW